jgi:hypothetical protein
MTIAEWIGTGAILVTPYLVIGVLWALFGSGGIGAVLWWPAMLVSEVCLA